MGDFGYAVLIIFIAIRILIAAGLFYLIVVEVRRYKRHRVRKDKEADEDANRKDTDSSHGSRN